MHSLDIVTQFQRGTQILVLAGVVDSNNFSQLAVPIKHHLHVSRRNGVAPQIVLDCTEVSYIGTAEMRDLIDLAQLARAQGGDVKCVRLAPTIEQIMNLIASGDPLDAYPDLPEALAALDLSAASSGR